MLKIYTVQISVARTLNLFEDPRFLDTTVKSGDKTFAPTWKMVMSYKAGELDSDAYTQQYYEMMRKSYRERRSRWDEVLAMNESFWRATAGRTVSATGICLKISW